MSVGSASAFVPDAPSSAASVGCSPMIGRVVLPDNPQMRISVQAMHPVQDPTPVITAVFFIFIFLTFVEIFFNGLGRVDILKLLI